MCSVNALDRISCLCPIFFLTGDALATPWLRACRERERETERERERERERVEGGRGGREGGRACVIMALLLQLRYRSIAL